MGNFRLKISQSSDFVDSDYLMLLPLSIGFVFCLSFEMQYFVSFTPFGERGWLLDLYCLLDVSCFCYCYMPLPHDAVSWSVVCICGIY